MDTQIFSYDENTILLELLQPPIPLQLPPLNLRSTEAQRATISVAGLTEENFQKSFRMAKGTTTSTNY